PLTDYVYRDRVASAASEQKNSATNEGTGQPEYIGQPGCIRNHRAEDLGVCRGWIQRGTQRGLITRSPAVAGLPGNDWCGRDTHCLCRGVWIGKPFHRYPCRVRCIARLVANGGARKKAH